MNQDETKKVCDLLFRNGTSMNPKFVGRSAKVIADAAGINIGDNIRVLIGEQYGVGPDYPLSYEKLTSVLGFYTVNDWQEACDLSFKLLENGIGHTMSLHTEDKDVVMKFSIKPASRILVNTGGTMGGTGLSTNLPIALTLGCGTMGGSSVSENVGPCHLVNIKKLVYGVKDCSTLVANDPIFKKYHVCDDHGSNDLPSYGSSANNYFEYSTGCCCNKKENDCSHSSHDSDKGINLEELQNIVNELVNAFKGE